MTPQEVIALMESSQSEQEWNKNCDKVKAACNGYPAFWYKSIILSGLGDQIASRWGGDMKIRVTSLA